MIAPRSKFAVFGMLALLWLAFCCMACDPADWDSSFRVFSVCAQKPSAADSLEMQVSYKWGDSAWVDTLTTVEKYDFRDRRNMVCGDCRYCDSLSRESDENKVQIDVSIGIYFYCSGKKIALPTYVMDSTTFYWGEDNARYRFVEYDERKIHGEYEVDSFLSPEDTSCGKFVNYAVLRLP